MSHTRSLLSAITAFAVVSSVASCSTPEDDGARALSRTSSQALAAWQAAMDASLSTQPGNDSAAGIGSGGGSLVVDPGLTDVSIACNGVDRLRFEVRTKAARPRSVNVACGVATTYRVDVPRSASIDVAVSATGRPISPTQGRDEGPLWYVVANPR